MPRAKGGAPMPSTRGASEQTITFGLVTLPVRVKKLEKPRTNTKIGASFICPKHLTRTSMPKFCDDCNSQVAAVKAYEVADGFVQISDDDLDTLIPDGGSLVVEGIEPLDNIDSGYFASTFEVWPEGDIRPYRVFAEALNQLGSAAVGKAVIGRAKSTQLVVLRWAEPFGCLVAQTCLYDDEIRWDDINLIADALDASPAPAKQEVDMAKQLLSQLPGGFDPTVVTDTFQEGLRAILETAKPGTPVAVPTSKAGSSAAGPQDLMEQLRQSISAAKKGARAQGAIAQRSTAKKPAAKKKAVR